MTQQHHQHQYHNPITLDLHIHSPFSTATSKYITLQRMADKAAELGIDIISTADCLHPQWWKQVKEQTQEDDDGYLRLPHNPIRFIPAVEVCCIWGRGKRCHVLLVMTVEAREHVKAALEMYAELDSNGRSDVVLSPDELLDVVKEADDDCIYIPAHVLTPWYGLMGDRLHLNSIYEVYRKDALPDAWETGLSADKNMVWSIPEMQGMSLVSFSDAHSIRNIGREVTVAEDGDIKQMLMQIKQGQIDTLEYPPALGKYHVSGCKKCQVRVQDNAICPRCGKKVVKGVVDRVKQLSGHSISTSTVDQYMILKDVLDEVVDEDVDATVRTYVEGRNSIINQVKRGQFIIMPGYAGIYGKLLKVKEEEVEEVDIAVKIRSRLLNEDIWLVGNERLKREKMQEGKDAVYMLKEIAALDRTEMSPAQIKKLHMAKKIMRGIIRRG